MRRLMGKTRLETILPLQEDVPEVVGPGQDIPIAQADAGSLAPVIAEAHRKLAELGGPDSEAYARVAEQIEDESRRHPRS